MGVIAGKPPDLIKVGLESSNVRPYEIQVALGSIDIERLRISPMPPQAPIKSAPSGLNETQYRWQRFWIPQSGMLDLSDAGFLREAIGDYFGTDVLRPLSELQEYRALTLLGEPGIGKSSELKQEHDRITTLAEGVRPASMYIDLKVGSSEEALRRRIFEAPTFNAWKEGAGHLVLHIDSLDEAMLRVETVANLLA